MAFNKLYYLSKVCIIFKPCTFLLDCIYLRAPRYHFPTCLCCLSGVSEFIWLYILLDKNGPQTVNSFSLILLTKLCNCPIVHLTLKVSMLSLFLMCKHLLLEASSWYHENRDFITLTFVTHRKASLTSVAWFTIDSMWFWDSFTFSKHGNDIC